MSNSLKVSLVYGWYTLDIESFIEQLCENKDRPELQCNGKCYLSKMDADTSTQDEQTIPVLEWDQLVFCQTEIALNEEDVLVVSECANLHYSMTYTRGYFQSIFHPP